MTGVRESRNEAKLSPKPETGSPEQHHVAQSPRVGAGVASRRSSPTPVPRLEQGVPAGPFPETWPDPLHPTGLLSCWEGLQGATSPLEGPGRGKCSAGAAATRDETPAGAVGTARNPGGPTGARPHTRHPMLASSVRTQSWLAGLFFFYFLSSRLLMKGSRDRLTAHFPAQQVMLACI